MARKPIGLAFAKPLAGFRKSDNGVAAVEFALIGPVAIALFGVLAIGAQGIAIQRKVTLTARTITDLVTRQGTTQSGTCSGGGQSASVSTSAIDNILNNAANVLYPYVKPNAGSNPVTGTNLSNMTMVVSQIGVDSSGSTATVQWSEPMPSHGTALATTVHGVALPASVGTSGTSLIMGTVTYAYSPPVIGEALVRFTPYGTIMLHDTIYLPIRQWCSLSLS